MIERLASIQSRAAYTPPTVSFSTQIIAQEQAVPVSEAESPVGPIRSLPPLFTPIVGYEQTGLVSERDASPQALVYTEIAPRIRTPAKEHVSDDDKIKRFLEQVAIEEKEEREREEREMSSAGGSAESSK